MKKYISLSLLLLSVSASGQDIYRQVKEDVRAWNLEILAERATRVAEYMEKKSENNLEDPEVEFGRVWGTNTSENKWDLSVTQTFDFPTVYRARQRAAESRRESGELALKAVILEKETEAEELLIELAYCDKSMAIEKEIMNHLETVVALLVKGYENGETTILDVNKAKIEYANACVAYSDTKNRRGEIMIRLRTLTGNHLDSVSGEVPYPVHELRAEAFYLEQAVANPLVAQYDALCREALLDRRVAKMRYLPKIAIGYVHEREGAESFDGFKVGLTLPFFSNRHKMEVSRASEDAARAMMQARLEGIQSEIKTDFQLASDKQWLFEKIAAVFNTDHPGLLYKAFRGGELSATAYLNELSYFRQAEADFLVVERDYHLALARLNRFN